MQEPTPNLPLLHEALAWVEEQDAARRAGQPSSWYQGEWYVCLEDADEDQDVEDVRQWLNRDSCGTAYCVAGWVVARDTRVRDLPSEEVQDLAQACLGLTTNEAAELFSGGNTVWDVREAVRMIEAGELR